jgi:hypothetical protein
LHPGVSLRWTRSLASRGRRGTIGLAAPLQPRTCRERPGGGGEVTQADVDQILKPYATRKSRIVQDATLMEFGSWRLGGDADESVRNDLFRAREFVAFAGLAARRLFQGFNYCNFASASGSGHPAVVGRRARALQWSCFATQSKSKPLKN